LNEPDPSRPAALGDKVLAKRRPFRRGTAILPSLFTTGNLFLGFWAIVKAFDGQAVEAAPLVGLAIVLDMLDGRIARLTGTTSEFGASLDSLADAISFGVAPALLAYRWALDDVHQGWLAAFLFATCGVLRLARFNVQKHADMRFFVGLPIPAAAGQLAAVIAFAPARVTGWVHGLFALLLVTGLALLMVSTLRYRSFKGIDLRRRRSYLAVLPIALLFIFVAAHLEYSLLAIATLYTLSAPGAYVFGLLFRRRGGAPPAPLATGELPGAAH
jgi:CDP-diacylglycerol--serine O-phosphatidyltransferase